MLVVGLIIGGIVGGIAGVGSMAMFNNVSYERGLKDGRRKGLKKA